MSNEAAECAFQHTVGQFQALVNWEGCSRNGIQHKILGWGGVLGSLALICVAAASQPVVMQSEARAGEFQQPAWQFHESDWQDMDEDVSLCLVWCCELTTTDCHH